uniref:Magnesium-dependent phosphatase 1 n=1 Tax=Trichobilharzia regenti TaxID=157069 RepID=A0AA85IXK0_TRIRE|nr:unnamed protein product [Trichobilharzia regenti]CAH8862553.1 unnamed protein product [Trichobilharzia regenti]
MLDIRTGYRSLDSQGGWLSDCVSVLQMSTSGFLSGFQRLPKLVVFDLDFTLWPLWCDTHVSPPFVRKNNVVYDSYESRVDVYPDSDKILRVIKASTTMKLACASRTAAIRVAEQLLQILGWSDLFDYKAIYPGCKITHFKRFHKLSGIEYADMVFLMMKNVISTISVD